MSRMSKSVCTECDWCGSDKLVLTAPSPFEEFDTIRGCPNCRSVNSLNVACDIQDCKEISTCGAPVKDEYLRMCGKHYREFAS